MYPRLTNRVLSGNSRLTYMDPNLIDVIPWSYHHEKFGEAEDHLNDFRTDVDQLSSQSDEFKMSFTYRHAQILKLLPDRLKKILYLYFKKRMQQKKLASKTGITQGAISHALHETQRLIADYQQLPDIFFDKKLLKEKLRSAELSEEQIAFFVCFLEMHHVSKAAIAVHRSQPWGSWTLIKLEKTLTGDLLKILKIAKTHFGNVYA